MKLEEITSTEWSFSLKGGAGEVVQGADDINQCIDIILRTVPGSDPYRPFFGSKVYMYQDKPLDVGIPNIKKEIINALGLWEPRIQLTSVKHVIIDAGTVKFLIEYKIKNSVLTGQYDFVYGIK